jgi:uncharacterized membrane protein YeaQ/YmgE (transglycosylase-associated protein family)
MAYYQQVSDDRLPCNQFVCDSRPLLQFRMQKTHWSIAAGRAQVYILGRPAGSGPRRRDMGFIAWIVVGLIAGWLAGQVMKGGGYGVLVDIILGILGGFVGGWIFGLLGIWPGGRMIGSIIVAFVGAVILVWISRLLKKA